MKSTYKPTVSTMSNQEDNLRDELQDFCEEYASVLEGNGKDYMGKWFNRNSDRFLNFIERLELDARLEELKYLLTEGVHFSHDYSEKEYRYILGRRIKSLTQAREGLE